MAKKLPEPTQSLLPEDLVFEILLRLKNVKSIGRFRLVSKAWRCLLSTLNSSNLNANYIWMAPKTSYVQKETSLYVSTFKPENNDSYTVANKKVLFPDFDPCWHYVVHGSCHDLVLLRCDGNLVLLNPITKEFVNDRGCVYDLGYDSRTDDYKIVGIQKDFLYVYDMKIKIWRTRLNPSPYRYRWIVDARVFVNGCLNFLFSIEDELVIVAFNLSTEEFKTMPCPKTFHHQPSRLDLLVLGGCVALFDHSGSCDVWLMKDYGVHDSWTKFTIAPRRDVLFMKPICFLGEDELVSLAELHNGSCKFVTYKFRSGASTDVAADGNIELPDPGWWYQVPNQIKFHREPCISQLQMS